jgi:phenylalanyl-tRNA synthetase beta subunit
MKVSLNWAQHYSNVDLKSIPTDELVEKIGAQLGAVEEVTAWGPRYDGILVAKVVSCEKHPDADKLHLCRIDDGGKAEGVERGDDGHVQVVCGAPNVKEGLTVAWLPPGTKVPSTLEKDPFVLEAREIRGKVSNGMLASPAELGISDNHDGILEINPEEVGEELAVPGTPFKQLYGLDDVVIDCENKMFTHRPDCFGILGVARELAGIMHQKFVSPEWYLQPPVFKTARDAGLKVEVSTGLVPRFMAVVMQNVNVGPSPMFMQAALTRVGIRPINNIVDITNWMMHLTGQPLHAYDYDKIVAKSSGAPSLQARLARNGETLALLNGKTVELDDKTVVIATDGPAVGVAGVMGGAETEVDGQTTSIILEAATFDMYAIRKTAMRYGLFTDAVTRFNKGQSPLQNDRVLAEAMRMVEEYAKGTQASDVTDYKDATVKSMPAVHVTSQFINNRLGTSLHAKDIRSLLENVECSGTTDGLNESRGYLKGTAPIEEKLSRIGVKIAEKTDLGYKLVIPAGTEAEYEKLVSWELPQGTWTEYIGAKNVFLFKDHDKKISRYEVSDDNEHEIVEMCRAFAGEYYTSLEAMLAANAWYKPLLPLHNRPQNEAVDEETVIVSPPFWRRDLERAEDIVEEVGRLYGFDRLPVELPRRPSLPAARSEEFELETQLRTILAAGGANEVLTYSFVHGKLLENTGQDVSEAFHVRNALSPDLQYYRLSLTPSLLDKVHMNSKAGYERFAVFEIGLIHSRKELDNGHLPIETKMLALTLADIRPEKDAGAPHYQARAYLDFLAAKLGLKFYYKPIEDAPASAILSPFELSRAAYVCLEGADEIAGIVGEYRPQVRADLKLPAYAAGFEIGLRELKKSTNRRQSYRPLSRYPKTQQDITFEVAGSLSYYALRDALEKMARNLALKHEYVWSLKPGDIYAPAASDRKRVTFHVDLSHPDRTLTIEESNKFLDDLTEQAGVECSARRI